MGNIPFAVLNNIHNKTNSLNNKVNTVGDRATNSVTLKEIDFIKDVILVTLSTALMQTIILHSKDLKNDSELRLLDNKNYKTLNKIKKKFEEYIELKNKLIKNLSLREQTFLGKGKHVKLFTEYIKEYEKSDKHNKKSVELIAIYLLLERFRGCYIKGNKNKIIKNVREIDPRLEELVDFKNLTHLSQDYVEAMGDITSEKEISKKICFKLKKMKVI